jgi:hypothetical protein
VQKYAIHSAATNDAFDSLINETTKLDFFLLPLRSSSNPLTLHLLIRRLCRHANEGGVNTPKTRNFIHELVERDLMEGKNGGRVHTRFPPEPNGYLHIGHAKAICIDFGAEEIWREMQPSFRRYQPYQRRSVEYVDSIKEDVRWLGFDWEDRLYYASDFFDQLYEFAVKLIQRRKSLCRQSTS